MRTSDLWTNASERLLALRMPSSVFALRAASLLGLMAISAISIVQPERTPELLIQLGVISVAAAALLFPWATVGIVIASVAISFEWFDGANRWVESHIGAIETMSIQKFIILVALVPAILRTSFRLKLNYPLLALVFMFCVTFTLATRLPSLTPFQSVKTLFGLGMAFFFFNLNLPRRTLDRFLLLIALLPLLSVILGYFAELHGFLGGDRRPWKLFPRDYDGVYRLGGASIAAGLANIAFTATFVSLYQALTRKKNAYYVLLGINFAILSLTLTRTPIAAAMVLCVLSALFVSHRSVNLTDRFVLLSLGGLLAAVLLVFLWPSLEARFFSGDSSGGLNTSGREAIWSIAMSAVEVNPIFGRGLGAGATFLLDNANQALVTTRATHNEYLRLALDGGIAGLLAFIGGFFLLIAREARDLTGDQKTVVGVLFFAFAFYSFTDNTLSGPQTAVLFLSLASIFALGRYEAADRRVLLAD